MSSTIILFDADAGAAVKSLALHHCVCSTVWMCSPAELLTHGEVLFHKTSMFYIYRYAIFNMNLKGHDHRFSQEKV